MHLGAAPRTSVVLLCMYTSAAVPVVPDAPNAIKVLPVPFCDLEMERHGTPLLHCGRKADSRSKSK